MLLQPESSKKIESTVGGLEEQVYRKIIYDLIYEEVICRGLKEYIRNKDQPRRGKLKFYFISNMVESFHCQFSWDSKYKQVI